MFEVLSQKTMVMAPLAFIIYILSAVIIGWSLYALRGYRVWAKRFERYHTYLPIKKRMRKNFGYVEYIPEVTRNYRYTPPTVDSPRGPYYPVDSEKTQFIENPSEPPIAGIHYSTKDDLKVVEGIGVKIEDLLNNDQICTWRDLAQTPIEKLRITLSNGGKKFKIHDPENWAYQAGLADQGDWKELEAYQNSIYAGVKGKTKLT